MPICLTGMHRSHTSMLARVLVDLGVYMGPPGSFSDPTEDNQAGYWEDLRFQAINEQLLALFGGKWDRPTLPSNWLSDPRVGKLREEARAVIASNQGHEPWGWKDPRTCLTLAFWADLIDDLKVVVSLRSPVEVARSLLYRRFEILPYDRGVELWGAYYRSLEDALGSIPCLVVHSDSLFADPPAELRRICQFLGLDSSEAEMAKARDSIHSDLRSGFVDTREKEALLPNEIVSQYARLSERAGPVYQGLKPVKIEATPEMYRRQIERLERVLDRRTEELLQVSKDRDSLRAEIERILATRWNRLRIQILRMLGKR